MPLPIRGVPATCTPKATLAPSIRRATCRRDGCPLGSLFGREGTPRRTCQSCQNAEEDEIGSRQKRGRWLPTGMSLSLPMRGTRRARAEGRLPRPLHPSHRKIKLATQPRRARLALRAEPPRRHCLPPPSSPRPREPPRPPPSAAPILHPIIPCDGSSGGGCYGVIGPYNTLVVIAHSWGCGCVVVVEISAGYTIRCNYCPLHYNQRSPESQLCLPRLATSFVKHLESFEN